MQFASNATTLLILRVYQLGREVPKSDGAPLDLRFQFVARLLQLSRTRLRLVKQMLTFRFLTLPFRQIVEEIDDADNLAILWISDWIDTDRDRNAAPIRSPYNDLLFMHGGPSA